MSLIRDLRPKFGRGWGEKKMLLLISGSQWGQFPTSGLGAVSEDVLGSSQLGTCYWHLVSGVKAGVLLNLLQRPGHLPTATENDQPQMSTVRGRKSLFWRPNLAAR